MKISTEKESLITQDYLKSILNYDPDSGAWSWIISPRPGLTVGSQADHVDPYGYKLIVINYKAYLASRLAWLYMTGKWPEYTVDHKNNDNTDDKWENLRLATYSQQCMNRRVRKDRKYDLPRGVEAVVTGGRFNGYRAVLMVNRKKYRSSLTQSAEEAHKAYIELSKQHHGEFGHL